MLAQISIAEILKVKCPLILANPTLSDYIFVPTGANCEVTINCGQAGTPNAPVNSPAGYFVSGFFRAQNRAANHA